MLVSQKFLKTQIFQHPFVLPEAMDRFIDFLRTNRYAWGFEAVKHGGWSTVTTSNVFGALQNATGDIEKCDRSIQSFRWQSRHDKSCQKRPDPFNISTFILEECVVMGAAKRQ